MLSVYPVATGRKTSINLCTFSMGQNPQRITLPFSLDQVVSVRVKSICWTSPPIDNSVTMLYLSCPELLIHAPSQSTILMQNPYPTNNSVNQLVHRRNLLACWTVPPLEAGIPNQNNNDPQPKINLSKLTSVNKLTLILEDDSNGILRETPFFASNLVTVTLEIEQVICM